ncbi:MAG: aminotransferase class V-fold PLP-dependent enzyme, partial [Acidimicrobiales bacterium]
MTSLASVDEARAMDREDPLAGFRDMFVIDNELSAYLDGNSLGRLPKATLSRLHETIEQGWGRRLVRAWHDSWMDLPLRVGDRLGAVALGAGGGQTVVADSTTINLYKVLDAAVRLRPERRELVIDRPNFPTDRYVVEAVAGSHGLEVRWLPPEAGGGVTARGLSANVGRDTAAVTLCHVDYRSGALADMGALTTIAHEAGGIVVWDLCHSVGVVPVSLDEHDVDLAVGCTYKYLNAGPGSPAFLYVASRLQEEIEPVIPGWIGAEDVFAMADVYRPAKGIRRMLSGSPNVLGLVSVDTGLEVIEAAGIEAIRSKSIALTEWASELCESS